MGDFISYVCFHLCLFVFSQTIQNFFTEMPTHRSLSRTFKIIIWIFSRNFPQVSFSSLPKPRDAFLFFLIARYRKYHFSRWNLFYFHVKSSCGNLYLSFVPVMVEWSFNNLTTFFCEAIKVNGIGNFPYWGRGRSFIFTLGRDENLFNLMTQWVERVKFIGSKENVIWWRGTGKARKL